VCTATIQTATLSSLCSTRPVSLTPSAFTTLGTCATLLCSKNVDPKLVQEMLGYANISQTLDIYSHVLPNMQDEAAAAIESAPT
jgi:site-specific recombinase XerD